MKKKFRFLLSVFLFIGMVGLGFSCGDFSRAGANNAHALNGGAAYITNGSEYIMKGGSIVGKTADSGGAIYVGTGSSFSMIGGVIDTCSAENGGGVYIESLVSHTMIGGVIQNCEATNGGAIFIGEGVTFTMLGGLIENCTATSGGAVYVSSGATFIMEGGKIDASAATNGGAVYVADGGTFIFNGGTIESSSATNGNAVYVASGGTFNYEENAGGFGSGEEVGSHVYAESGAEIVPELPKLINIYVDGTLSKTLKRAGASYLIAESDMPLDYESCCGYFYDEKLSKCTNGIVDLSNGNINIYTKTASDPSNFTFTLNESTGTYDISKSSTSISGHMVLPKEYNNVQTSINSATSSSAGAFYGCSSLTGITFQDGLTSIGGYAFYSRSSMTCEIVIPDSVTSIGVSAFGYCSKITGSLIIPNNVTSIGKGAFQSCSKITGSLTIGNSVISIGENAFSGCSGLTGELIIPNNVTSISTGAFAGCTGITSVSVSGGHSVYEDRGKNVIVEKSTNKIIQGFNCTNMGILEEITSIGTYAFSSITISTVNLVIPNNITSIEDHAFYYCKGFTSLTIGNGLSSIGDYVFSNSSLTSLSLGNSVTNIGDHAFWSCSSLTGNLIIPDSVISIGSYAFAKCSRLNGILLIGNSVTSIGSSAFRDCSKLTSVYIPSTVTTISASGYNSAPFYYCSSSLVIYTDVANASSVPSGWSTYWNYQSGVAHTTNYGYTLAQYKAAVGLTFAPTNNDGVGEELAGDIQVSNHTRSNFDFAGDYNLDAIINEEKEYVAILKENEKIA